MGTILSARTKDACTAGAVRRLFARMGGRATPEALENIPLDELEKRSLWGCKESDTTKQLTHTHALLPPVPGPWQFLAGPRLQPNVGIGCNAGTVTRAQKRMTKPSIHLPIYPPTHLADPHMAPL